MRIQLYWLLLHNCPVTAVGLDERTVCVWLRKAGS